MIGPAILPGERILLVDDSKSARFVLRTLLQKRGLTVDMADSAEVALEMIQNAPPDAVFMAHLKLDPTTKFHLLETLKKCMTRGGPRKYANLGQTNTQFNMRAFGRHI